MAEKSSFKDWLSRNKWIVIACAIGVFAVSQCVNSCTKGNELRKGGASSREMEYRADSLDRVVSAKDDTIRTLTLIVSERDKMIDELRKANSRPIKISIPSQDRK